MIDSPPKVGWRRLKLGDLGTFVNGVAFKPTDWGNDGLPIIRIQNLTNPAKPLNRTTRSVDPIYLVEDGDILVSWSATLDAFIWNRGPALLNQHIFKITPNDDRVDKRFLFHLLRRSISEMMQTDNLHGSTMKHINRGPFLAHAVMVPDIPAQIQIADQIDVHLSRLDAGIASLKRAQANLKRYRASVLKAACEGRLVPTEAELAQQEGRTYENGDLVLTHSLAIRRANASGKDVSATAISTRVPKETPVPEGWAYGALSDLFSVKGGITKDQKRKFSSPAREVPYLRVANVQRGHLNLTEVKSILASEDDIRELGLAPGDILLNEGGDRDKLGRGWVWEGQIAECIHQNHVFRARAYDPTLKTKFFSWYANTFGQQFFFTGGIQTTNLASLSMSKVRSFPVPIPPIAEQERIVAEVDRRLSIIDQLEATITANLLRANRLRQSVLTKAFIGSQD